MDGNETMIFKFYACLSTRLGRPCFRPWPRERSCGTIETREDEPHADSLLYSLHFSSRGCKFIPWGITSLSTCMSET